jgi:drug/metabolite transporter (DMT)-like permease
MLLVVLFWGGNFTAVKLAFTQLDPLAFTAMRFAAGSIVLWWVVRWLEHPEPLPRGAFWPLVWLGLIGNTAYQVCFILGLDRTSATKSSLILAGMPAMVTLAAWILHVEPVTVRQRWAVLAATVGVVVVLLARGGSLGWGIGSGELLLLGANLLWAAYTLLLRRWKLPMSPLRITAWVTYTGTPGLVLLGLPGVLHTHWSTVSAAGWGGLAYSTLLSLVAAYIFWNYGVANLGASRTVVYNTMVPLVATVIAMIGLGERPGLFHLLGGALIIAGVLMTRRRPAIVDSRPLAPRP